MGRKASVEANTMYNLALDSIQGLEIGQFNIISMPNNLAYYRKYLSEIGKRTGKTFRTKVEDNKLHVFRVPYSNIHSKQLG